MGFGGYITGGESLQWNMSESNKFLLVLVVQIVFKVKICDDTLFCCEQFHTCYNLMHNMFKDDVLKRR